MKDKILNAVANSKKSSHVFQTINMQEFFVVDWKHHNGGDIEIHQTLPKVPETGYEYDGVKIINENQIEIEADLFGDNALEITKKKRHKQCECILFPKTCADEDWILLIELKYIHTDSSSYLKYADSIKMQLIGTSTFLKENKIIAPQKQMFAMVAFPTITSDSYSAFIYNPDEILEFYHEHGIILRATDSVKIISETEIEI